MLRSAAAAIAALAVVASVVLTGAASGARSQISTVGSTDAPSVRAANDFLFKLQDMDAQLVNALLVNGDGNVHVPRAQSEGLYDQDRKDADADLESATAALAGNTDALTKLHDVIDTFGAYQAQAARTMADDERDGGSVAGQAPGSVLADYTAANAILFGASNSGGLMNAAKDLEQSSRSALDTSANSATDSLNMVLAEFTIFGLLLIAALVGLQLLIFRRFHRILNPALAAATTAALILAIGGAIGTTGAANDFHTAKSSAFDSVLALGEANALSAGINSDESRWLLLYSQPDQRAKYEQSFLTGERGIADVSMDNNTIPGYAGALDAALTPLTSDNLATNTMTANSSFGKEFRNITFPGEAQDALTAFTAYDTYIRDDENLRAMPLSTPAELKTAIDFDTDAKSAGSSDQAFNAYTQALGDVTTINENQYESAMPAAKNGIGTWIWLPYLLGALMIGLTVLGLRPRLNEYR